MVLGADARPSCSGRVLTAPRPRLVHSSVLLGPHLLSLDSLQDNLGAQGPQLQIPVGLAVCLCLLIPQRCSPKNRQPPAPSSLILA